VQAHAENARETPNADPAEIEKFDALAGRFWDPAGEFGPLHKLNPLRVEYVARAASLAGQRVLDVGCGGGLLAESLAGRGAAVTGIDLSPALITTAELHALEGGVAVRYRLISAEALADEAPGAYDLVTCMEMLEHVPDPASVIGALARLVRPGGSVVVSTLNRTPKAFLLAIVGAEYIARALPRGTHEYAKFIRPSELGRAARSHGLQVKDVTGLVMDPFTRTFRLAADVGVNYLCHLVRPEPDAA
jgi:2-polyprenyl-6-hydroxyphenyl methylase/3-demethylubiquinone-9 3-methyltransferase